MHKKLSVLSAVACVSSNLFALGSPPPALGLQEASQSLSKLAGRYRGARNCELKVSVSQSHVRLELRRDGVSVPMVLERRDVELKLAQPQKLLKFKRRNGEGLAEQTAEFVLAVNAQREIVAAGATRVTQLFVFVPGDAESVECRGLRKQH